MRMARGALRAAGVVLALSVLLTACGKNNDSASGSNSSPAKASALGTRSFSGIGVVLDDQGFTLYHLVSEKSGQIVCTGSCAGVWPPLLTTPGALPATPQGVPGMLGTIQRPDGGLQLTYDGMPLYRYSGDTRPGQANGQGIQDVWFAVTTAGSSPGPVTTSPPAGGGYHY
jgi:predicted lipoprotein with Yx(FWY)xxD motif